MDSIFKVVKKEGQTANQPEQSKEEVMVLIEKDLKANPILLYMKGTPNDPQCGFSAKVVEILEELKFPYESRNVLENQVLRESIKQFSNWPTVPQLYAKGELLGGCDIVYDLYTKGELKTLLARALAEE